VHARCRHPGCRAWAPPAVPGPKAAELARLWALAKRGLPCGARALPFDVAARLGMPGGLSRVDWERLPFPPLGLAVAKELASWPGRAPALRKASARAIACVLPSWRSPGLLGGLWLRGDGWEEWLGDGEPEQGLFGLEQLLEAAPGPVVAMPDPWSLACLRLRHGRASPLPFPGVAWLPGRPLARSAVVQAPSPWFPSAEALAAARLSAAPGAWFAAARRHSSAVPPEWNEASTRDPTRISKARSRRRSEPKPQGASDAHSETSGSSRSALDIQSRCNESSN